jgi:hypothetical protein
MSEASTQTPKVQGKVLWYGWYILFNSALLKCVILDGAEHDNGEQAEEMLPTWGEALIRPEKGI